MNDDDDGGDDNDDDDDDGTVMRNEARAKVLRASNAMGRNGEFHSPVPEWKCSRQKSFRVSTK